MDHSLKDKILQQPSFLNPDPFPRDRGDAIHVWKIPVIETDLSLLTAPEKAFAEKFRFDGDRNRFAAGRQSLRFLLSKYLSISAAEILIAGERNQKPLISHPSADIRFNISHSGDWVLIAFSKQELGIDVEKADAGFDYRILLPEHFTEAEQNFIARAADPVAAFYFLWTRKEALTKAWGTGLQENLKSVAVLDANAYYDSYNKDWHLKSFQTAPGYSAALAFGGDLRQINYFNGGEMDWGQ